MAHTRTYDGPVDDQREPASPFDPARPNVARVYDYLLGRESCQVFSRTRYPGEPAGLRADGW
jgi:hypothetical protein